MLCYTTSLKSSARSIRACSVARGWVSRLQRRAAALTGVLQAGAASCVVLAAAPGTAWAAGAATDGVWGPLKNWPLVAVHAVLLPDGKVLSYGSRADGQQTANFEINIWDNTGDPGTGHMLLPNGTGVDMFCSSQLLLPPTSASSTPQVFVAGGDNWTGTGTTNTGNRDTVVINPGTGVLQRSAQMNRARWYSTSTTLPNGEIYIQGGSGGTDRPEVRQTNGSFRALSGADTAGLQFMYPRNFITPDGRLFGYDGAGAMYFVNPADAGSVTRVGNFQGQYGSADASAAMFRPGRILQFGGNSNGALVIDVTGANPVVTPTQSMATQRRLASATILADGRVMAAGGGRVFNDPATAENRIEIWDPTTGQWTLGPAAARPRLYHANALLLPDASVLVTGGGAPSTSPQLNAQIYYPSYLYNASGQRATRPTIANAPAWLDIGKTFALTLGSAQNVSRMVLVKTGSATHNWNMEQRYVELAFAGSGTQWSVQAPARSGEAPPGYYMLFVFDQAGVPSIARIVRIGVAPVANPQTMPTLTNPGSQSTLRGTSVSLQLAATDPNGDLLRFAATGLPAGLSLNAITGSITGSPTTEGNYNVVLAVSDGVNSSSVSLVWSVAQSQPLALGALPIPTPTVSGNTIGFTAAATGQGVQYQWDFGDGSAPTAWSANAAVNKSYALAGSYVVTLRVRSSSGEQISRSFLQTIYYPTTANAPTASTGMLIETPAGGNARLWVVNADDESVAVFDAVTRARLGIVRVGADPRTIALAPSGLLWVTNKRGASISVIDPATRTVVRTVALPAASQPHGVAMSPTAARAFVALEATGQLLALDTTTYATVGSLALGPNVRHVSVSANGADVYVSRFITPMLPGESTATISTSAAVGAQVLQVNAANLSLVRTSVLAHRDLPDAENQGSGVPNYLGAAVISPDGRQAYVPSKLDNVKRGTLRNNAALNFQNTVRAASSRLALTGALAGREDPAGRIDHDNASMASAALFDARGTLLFVALETSREVAVIDAHSARQLMRINVGRAPQALALSADGLTLYISNFMDRSVSVHDLRPLLQQGLYSAPQLALLGTVSSERLPVAVLQGKQFFYDARDTRLARDSYMSCASCHNDGGQDGRVWDFTQSGEGLRNTISLRGRAAGQGRLHWSANFDEIQDFEGQIRALAGGTGLMSDADFNTGTRRDPLGDRKAGISAPLDALAAYVASLNTSDPSPLRLANGNLTTQAIAGRTVFAAQCASCHAGVDFTDSAKQVLHDVGTQSASSGKRLFGPLWGIDAPTLRDVWATAPYLHDGRAATLADAVRAHVRTTLNATDLAAVVAYVGQIGGNEVQAPASEARLLLRAQATWADYAGAAFDVRLNGTVVASGQLDSITPVELPIQSAALNSGDRVDVVFKNDAFSNGQDRNLAVSWLQVDGSNRINATAPGVLIDVGTGAAAFDGLDVVTGASMGGWIPWDAAIRFTLPTLAGGSNITVRGSATLAGGVGAAIEVRLNGVVVGSRMVSNTTVQDWVFETPPVQLGDRIDIVFVNDAIIGGVDRNLYVQSVTAAGMTVLSTASGVTLDEGFGADAFDGINVVPGDLFGGWLPWNGALRLRLPN